MLNYFDFSICMSASVTAVIQAFQVNFVYHDNLLLILFVKEVLSTVWWRGQAP